MRACVIVALFGQCQVKYLCTNFCLLPSVAAANLSWALPLVPAHKFPPHWSCPVRSLGRVLVRQQQCRQWEGQAMGAGIDLTGVAVTLGAVSHLLRRGEGVKLGGVSRNGREEKGGRG